MVTADHIGRVAVDNVASVYPGAKERLPLGVPLNPRSTTVPDPFEASLLDVTALDEIEMTSQLMIAATGCAGHLTQREVDRILGIAIPR